jgi:hypothetical protein
VLAFSTWLTAPYDLIKDNRELVVDAMGPGQLMAGSSKPLGTSISGDPNNQAFLP